MTKAGWVVSTEDEEGGKRRKKIYQVQAQGRDELARWVAEPGGIAESSQALLIKLRAEAVMGPLGVHNELLRLIDHHKARLDVYLKIEQRDFSSVPLSVAQRLQHAVLRRGIMLEENWLKWADEVLPLVNPQVQ